VLGAQVVEALERREQALVLGEPQERTTPCGGSR
jgi:hypothetical protein